MMNTDKIPRQVKEVCERLSENGFEAFVVGGAVRDYYMGRTPKDWDISTNAKPSQVTDLFEKVVPTGLKFGTVTVHHDGMELEITTYRSDGKYSDGRRPDEVSFASTVEEDLSRRDFRMNAMAMNPNSGRILDPYNGILDIGSKVINTVGEAQDRFGEDALRMMRAIRFAAQLGFQVNHTVFRAIARLRRSLEQVSMERIRDEFLKILSSRDPRIGVELMCESGVMDLVVPQFSRTKGCQQNMWHSFDVYGHCINVMEVLPPDPVLRLAGLLHDIGKPDTQTPHPHRKGEFRFLDHDRVGALYVEGIAKRLKLPGSDVKRIVHIVKHHMRLMNVPTSDSGIRKLLKDLGSENIEEFILFRRADMVDNPKKQVMITEFDKECDRIRKILSSKPVLDSKGLAVNGHDLMEYFGIAGGPEVGRMIKFLTETVIDHPELNTKEQLLELLENKHENPSLE